MENEQKSLEQKVRILVVESEEQNLEAAKNFFNEKKIYVDYATSYEEADILTETSCDRLGNRYDGMITDNCMPFIKKTRKEKAIPRVILVSKHNNTKEVLNNYFKFRFGINIYEFRKMNPNELCELIVNVDWTTIDKTRIGTWQNAFSALMEHIGTFYDKNKYVRLEMDARESSMPKEKKDFPY